MMSMLKKIVLFPISLFVAFLALMARWLLTLSSYVVAPLMLYIFGCGIYTAYRQTWDPVPHFGRRIQRRRTESGYLWRSRTPSPAKAEPHRTRTKISDASGYSGKTGRGKEHGVCSLGKAI